MAEYELTTSPGLSEAWSKLDADEKTYSLVANRATDDNIKANAATKRDELREERTALEEKIAAAARVLTVERINPKAWGRIVAENPVRPDVPWDVQMGFNTDSFDKALMPLAVTSVTDGYGTEVDWDWGELVELMSPGQYNEIMSDTLRLHMEREAVPFSLADWRSRRNSEQSSK